MKMGIQHFLPGLAQLKNYRPGWFRHDVMAGLSVATVALPVGIAYADLAGVPAVMGIYAAIFPLFAYALFGSSRQLMTGPDAATCIMVAASLGPLAGGDPARYQALLAMLTLITGALYVLAGVLKLGFIANFLALPILSGFLNGVALLIVVGQLPKLLGYPSTAEGFLPKAAEALSGFGELHPATAALGLGLMLLMLALKRWLPRLPNALLVVILGIVLVKLLGLDQGGVAVLGQVPAGLPQFFTLPDLALDDYRTLFRDALALVLVSFTSGVLTAKSFAQRNGYEIRPNQELIGFGACNLASALVQGFPVTGADSRTAVNDAMGGKSQLVGIIAGLAMLAVLFFLTAPLALVPNTALAAVIIVSAAGLFDWASLRQMLAISRIAFLFSVGTSVGVLLLGVLPGVLLAVVIALLLLLAVESRPRDAVLAKVEGVKGFHNRDDYEHCHTLPGLLIFRFEGNLVFYNADYFRERLLEVLAREETEVRWIVVDAAPISVVDITALHTIDQLYQELSKRGIRLVFARERHHLGRFFRGSWLSAQRSMVPEDGYPTLNAAWEAYCKEQLPGNQNR